MRGPSRSIWPIHYKPFPDELLSSWIVRLAHGHGLRVQTFCNLYCGNDYQVWVRDIDRRPPRWLLDEFSLRTNTPPERILETTLRAYEGILFDKMRGEGQAAWILTVQKYHRKVMGHGTQYCPSCLAEDAVPFFRKHWRLAFYTRCPQHKRLLRDRCAICGAAIALHRIDMHIKDFGAVSSMSMARCHNCGVDLRNEPGVVPEVYDRRASAFLERLCEHAQGKSKMRGWSLGHFAVLHHLCRVLTMDNPHTRLREHVEGKLSLPSGRLVTGLRMPIESRSIEERDHTMQLAAWLAVKLEPRLTEAWRAGAIRYNILLKDFDMPPDWYVEIVEKMANWRDRFV